MNIASSYHVSGADCVAEKKPLYSGKPFEIGEPEPAEEKQAGEEKAGWLERYAKSDEEEEDKKKEVLIDYLMKALKSKDMKEDSSQTKEEKGAENLAIMSEMNEKICSEFGARMLSGDALNAPHLTYWIR